MTNLVITIHILALTYIYAVYIKGFNETFDEFEARNRKLKAVSGGLKGPYK